ncbi:hypothetical protein B0O80DRAFT_68565 [Mortierella sp. GBAus27b]|nr:hypothetical protein B0O80DRAFT_68565 [Mortierella sp. GBAus27b]
MHAWRFYIPPPCAGRWQGLGCRSWDLLLSTHFVFMFGWALTQALKHVTDCASLLQEGVQSISEAQKHPCIHGGSMSANSPSASGIGQEAGWLRRGENTAAECGSYRRGAISIPPHPSSSELLRMFVPHGA